jgi:hypothetical protein
MEYVLYNKRTSAIVEIVRHRPYKVTVSYKSLAAAKAAVTRESKAWFNRNVANCKLGDIVDFTQDPQFLYGIADVDYYLENIEKDVERTNYMTGEKFMESVNTPYYASPRSETYWSA